MGLRGEAIFPPCVSEIKIVTNAKKKFLNG